MKTKLIQATLFIFLSFSSYANASNCPAEILDDNSLGTNTFPLKNNPCIIFGGAAVVDDTEHPQAPALMLRRFSTSVIAANRALPWNERNFQTELARKTQSTTGVTMRFKTNSPTVTLNFVKDTSLVSDPDNITQQDIDDKKIDTSFGAFSLEQDGVSYSGTTSPNNQSGVLVLNNTGGGLTQEYQLTFPIWQNPILAKIELEDGHLLEPITELNKPIYVAIGDSISHGQKQKYSIETWPWLVADKLNYELYNLAVGGSKTNAVQTSMIGEIPKVDLVTILWGYNDIHSRQKPADVYKADMLAVYNEIRSHHQNTTIVFMPILTAAAEGTHENATPERVALENEYRAVIRDLYWQLQVNDNNLHLIDSDTFTNTADLAENNDPVHLSISGAAKLAVAVANAVSDFQDTTATQYEVLAPIASSTGPHLINEEVIIYVQATADSITIDDFSLFEQVQLSFRKVIDETNYSNEITKSVTISDGSFVYDFSDYQVGDIIEVRAGIILDDTGEFTYGSWLNLSALIEPETNEPETSEPETSEPEDSNSSGGALYLLLILMSFALAKTREIKI